MREIKFRGIDKSLKIWVYGNLIAGIDLDGKSFSQIEIADAGQHRVYQAEESTVGQFTGLLDKTGVQIFEGDQITSSDFYGTNHGEVVWWNDRWVSKYIANEHIQHQSLMTVKNVEVIGNIHENL